ncbi:MAG: hypothetical protein WB660_27385 [Candidatus Sulfotelmatobacter sp.]
MEKENPQSELSRLRKEQSKARQDEVFGGLSPAERAEYNEKAKRIDELKIELRASAAANSSKRGTKAEHKGQWNKESETDTLQSEAHQPYRSREKAPIDDDTNSSKRKPSKEKNESEEKKAARA